LRARTVLLEAGLPFEVLFETMVLLVVTVSFEVETMVLLVVTVLFEVLFETVVTVLFVVLQGNMYTGIVKVILEYL